MAGIIGGAIPGIGVDWRTAYYIGGGMGLTLLVLRIGVVESGMFASMATNKQLSRGNFFRLFTSARRFGRYLAIIGVGVPVWYVIGILCTLAPELGPALGLSETPRAAMSVLLAYGGLTLGDLGSGLLSHRLRSRRTALGIFLAATAATVIGFFALGGTSLTMFYVMTALAGVAIGYWAVFVSTAAELFGTNLRATVATTVPNFVRGSLVLINLSHGALREPLGLVGASIAIGAASLGVAFAGLFALRETFGVDLDFHEVGQGASPREGATSGA